MINPYEYWRLSSKLYVHSLELYISQNNTSSDEYLTLFKGSLKFEAYVASKQECYRIKVNMLSESHTGYFSDSLAYTNADTELSNKLPKKVFEDYWNPSKIVLSILGSEYSCTSKYARVLSIPFLKYESSVSWNIRTAFFWEKIRTFLGLDFFIFPSLGWKVQSSISGNVRKAFFWENIRFL